MSLAPLPRRAESGRLLPYSLEGNSHLLLALDDVLAPNPYTGKSPAGPSRAGDNPVLLNRLVSCRTIAHEACRKARGHGHDRGHDHP